MFSLIRHTWKLTEICLSICFSKFKLYLQGICLEWILKIDRYLFTYLFTLFTGCENEKNCFKIVLLSLLSLQGIFGEWHSFALLFNRFLVDTKEWKEKQKKKTVENFVDFLALLWENLFFWWSQRKRGRAVGSGRHVSGNTGGLSSR